MDFKDVLWVVKHIQPDSKGWIYNLRMKFIDDLRALGFSGRVYQLTAGVGVRDENRWKEVAEVQIYPDVERAKDGLLECVESFKREVGVAQIVGVQPNDDGRMVLIKLKSVVVTRYQIFSCTLEQYAQEKFPSDLRRSSAPVEAGKGG